MSLVMLGAIAACGDGHAATSDTARADSIARVRQDFLNRVQPGYIIDSILPVEEQLRRFRASTPDTVRSLQGGASTRNELVRTFARSVESADTATLVRLTISRAEFAWLLYPESPFSAPPYRQAPDLVWMRHTAGSGSGLTRLLDRLGGSPLRFQSYSCPDHPMREGANQVWRDCVIRFADRDGAMRSLRLFSGIVERHGQFKILSYANGF